MTKFHIVWYINPTDFFSTGRNYMALDAEQALKEWREANPTGVFKAMYTTD